jgi:hypothetical protein
MLEALARLFVDLEALASPGTGVAAEIATSLYPRFV